MMQQYREAKEKHPGMLLLFRMGDFFELFDADAEVAARILGLTLTSRDKTIPMAGFPHHALEPHLHKLLQAGHRVAICDQVEDASQAKGLVRREVIRVVTPGTVTEDDLLDPKSANFLASVFLQGKCLGLAWVDLTAGHFWGTDLDPDRFSNEMGRLNPAEVILGEKDPGGFQNRFPMICPNTTVTLRPDWTFAPDTARKALFDHFRVTTFAGFGFSDDQPCLAAAGALLLYLQDTLKANLSHLSRLRAFRHDNFLMIDEVTRRSLELTRTMREGQRDGSVLSILDRTVTPMGARLFQDWLVAPLANKGKIEARLDAVAELADNNSLRTELRESLAQSYDLPRLTSRASTGRASPKDLAAVGRTLRLLPRVKAKLTGRKARFLQELEGQLELFPDLRENLDKALVDNPPTNAKEGGVIRTGFDPELDKLHKIASGGKEWLAKFQAEEILRTGINSLKVGYNKVFGYYIEITHAHATKIPPNYQRKQTLKNAERYITAELKEHEETVLGAQEKSHQREYDLFLKLRDQVAAQTERLLQTAEVMAQLDVLASFAELAVSQQYGRPQLTDEPI